MQRGDACAVQATELGTGDVEDRHDSSIGSGLGFRRELFRALARLVGDPSGFDAGGLERRRCLVVGALRVGP
jgi:hypothetical protein